jgi:hypothetical protein
MLSTVLPIRSVSSPFASEGHDLDLESLPGGVFQRASDGWHGIVPVGGAKHRLWLQELPANRSVLAVEIPFDASYEMRVQAASRFWLALGKHPVGPSIPLLTNQRRQRLILTIRAADGWTAGNSYRDIAEGLFGHRRIPEKGWKTHDLRNRTIRLVKNGLSLMRGGYRAWLRRGFKRG